MTTISNRDRPSGENRFKQAAGPDTQKEHHADHPPEAAGKAGATIDDKARHAMEETVAVPNERPPSTVPDRKGATQKAVEDLDNGLSVTPNGKK